jgi:pimeloyl-ACP methyl ester carboxylesterase
LSARVIGAILRKDLRSLFPLVLLGALLFAGDVFILRWELVPLWHEFRQTLLALVGALLTLAVFQLDAPVSLVDDWLCRPVPRRELVAAKLAFLVLVIYLPGALATLVAGLCLGASATESSLDALLLQDPYFPLIAPLLLLTALVTRSLVQGMGTLITLFVCMFVIPTPFVSAPSPLNPAIGDALLGNGLRWLSLAPNTLVALLLGALGLWLVYARRRIVQARILLVITAGLNVLLFLLPMWLLPWNSIFAAQASLNAAEPALDTRQIYLRHTRACFPATRVGELARDAAFGAARESSGVRLWSNEDLQEAGPDSIAFLTTVEPRRLPADWRVNLNHVQADYQAQGRRLFSLRPALYNTGLSHAWVLPASALRQLEGVDVALDLDYSLTLLEPKAFSLPTDGRRHRFPGLGFCSAEVNGAANRIDVRCFSALHMPAQITAELNDIPASRAYSPADFSPAWTRWPFSQRVELHIDSPRLATHETVTVTAWEVAGYLDESVSFPGTLGADPQTCRLPGAGSGSFQASRWRDTASHEPSSISVEGGVQLEVLDFGGEGSPILLLPGLGATAHSFDELAPLLARNHRVVAMTRRGIGYSSKPDFGFDTPRLAQDVLAVMDALGLGKVLLVGHSIAGDELTWLGGHHAQRFSGLVYLDAAYDRSGKGSDAASQRLRDLERSLPPDAPIPPEALRDYASMAKLLRERGHVMLPEGELIAAYQVDEPFLGGTPSIDPRTQQAMVAAIRPPDYGALQVPALAIYAIVNPDEPPPARYDRDDAELMATLAEIAELRRAIQRRNIELFATRTAKGQVLEMPNAKHYIQQSNTTEVRDAIEKFVAELGR